MRNTDQALGSPFEGRQILKDWNATEVGYAREKRVHCLFQEQVE